VDAVSEDDQPKTLTGVFIDHNVWDILLALRIDLDVEFPRDLFGIGITREAEFEIAATAAANPALKAYIDEIIERRGITVDSYFGFFDPTLPLDEQRVGGFDVGRWASAPELQFIASQRQRPQTTKRKTKLHKDEADISLAARSFAASTIVLTCDKDRGPLRDAHRQGGNVIYLNDFPTSGLALGDYVAAAIAARSSRTA